MVDLRASSRSGAPRTPGDDVAALASGPSTQTSRHPSPRKNGRVLPTPDSLSPSTSKHSPRLPPNFEPTHQLPPALPSRYSYPPQSPYRPGQYQQSECAPSERTRIGRAGTRLFQEDDDGNVPTSDDLASSSPLQPAFEPKMVLRNGASVDLISWLRTNFHHQPPPHTPVTSVMNLNHVQRLLQERFPRVPDQVELKRAVLAAFPHSQWDEPLQHSAPEPPIMRGLAWIGRDVAEEDDDTPGRTRPIQRRPRLDANDNGQSRSPTNSPLLSPDSSSTRRAMPDTPARSVLDEFAEIVTRTPGVKERSLEPLTLPLPAHAPTVPQSVDRSWRKRPASQSPGRVRKRRASTPDALQELLEAAEAIEGSPLTTSKMERGGHKRRRTIAGGSTTQDFAAGLSFAAHRGRSVRGTASPQIAGLSLLNSKEAEEDGPVSPLASEESHASQLIAMGQGRWGPRGGSSSTSQLSQVSEVAAPAVAPKGAGRKVNELPTSTQGQFPGYDCKPPYPYHEMIRFAIEAAPDRKLQLAQIYSSIAERFPFFKTLDEKKTAGWQNSIRHNLSLKKMFVRVNKADGTDEGGKGGWWTVQPGVPDEGRPGRKAKAKRAKAEAESGPASWTSTAVGTPVPPGVKIAPSPAPSVATLPGPTPRPTPSPAVTRLPLPKLEQHKLEPLGRPIAPMAPQPLAPLAPQTQGQRNPTTALAPNGAPNIAPYPRAPTMSATAGDPFVDEKSS
ncbi:hypothetical protein CcaverHIS002_0411090 [Cutaneotrichosporon cavernicola]|uniref:Fork-head domain-containing protein n=1 Tax=Cutaneotrichosporon cavernicola TaxID=279322 RepID=A0AA48QWD8_9TREE|nr:uncharacterized protein CcaverHIS019_0411000 [Cutaneotrichosporon cavernicola]BEI84505.1 hypothetical protein CcaverHIS002_0411090 [Cutaneotrichosporon cavernicola]BEI92280.1 hypothetical protein CcaverHIS019_0411000 [Cutaneotrichosporon cavernicola]BEJ00052.1 hypothetical protein CcaverHIS631_0410940 [Cutaneotrichosporon cavernicola]BEJ07824.1 hypothetical protein CcaverHIS641_0410930 [Cutaneotrichosporon cavernicola]